MTSESDLHIRHARSSL